MRGGAVDGWVRARASNRDVRIPRISVCLPGRNSVHIFREKIRVLQCMRSLRSSSMDMLTVPRAHEGNAFLSSLVSMLLY